MNPKTIYRIDRYIGTPLCSILSKFRWLTRLFKRPPKQGVPKKILFLKLTEQGATVLAYRAISRAIELVGRENVYFWVFQENRPILDILKLVPEDNVVCIRNAGVFNTSYDVLATLFRVRSLGIDTIIDMELFARSSAALSYMSGAERRVGLHRFTTEAPYRGDLFTHRVHYNPYIHTAAAQLMLVEASTMDPNERPMLKVSPPSGSFFPPMFEPEPDERAAMLKLLEEHGVNEGDGPRIILNPNASDMLPLRKWALENFIEVGRKLLAAYPSAKIIITGSEAERPATERMVEAMGSQNAIGVAGKTTLRSLLVLYSMCDALLTNDSGPGHFCALTSIRTLVLFGPETPLLYGPISPRAEVVYKSLACSPCVSAYNHRVSPCNNNVCMQRITPDEVFKRLRTMLSKDETPP